MQVKVLFFAACRDVTGSRELEIELREGALVADLKRALRSLYPGLARMERTLCVAVNAEYAGDRSALAAGDEVALIPPVSGG